ncbi:MAG: hypothetical protein AB7Q97_05615 [Gammaproteobacteria bacterium]
MYGQNINEFLENLVNTTVLVGWAIVLAAVTFAAFSSITPIA